MKRILLLALILISQSALAETWKLDKYLRVTPPESADVTFQVFEEYDPKEKLLMGWKGESLEYLWVVEKERGGSKESAYWKGLEYGLKKESDNKKIKTLSKGNYTTDTGVDVNYRIYSWKSDGDDYVQMINLIKGKKYYYWVIVTPTDNSKINYVTKKAIPVLKTAEVTK